MPIRTTEPRDVDGLVAMAVAAGMFAAEERAFLDDMFADFFAGRGAGEGAFCVSETADDGTLRGMAYAEPVRATQGTYNLRMIVVDPALQRSGLGRSLMAHMEGLARAADGHLMLVETEGGDDYAGTRAFYARVGYNEEARVRDYWGKGSDMVLFRKLLA